VTARADAVPASARDRTSWIDGLMARIDAAPGPHVVTYVAIFGAFLALDVGAHWAAGFEVGTVTNIRLVEASLPVLLLGVLDWLNRVASRALDHLRSALVIDDADVEAVRRDLLRTPASWAAAAGILGLMEAVVSIVTVPVSYGIEPGSPPVIWIGATIVGAPTTMIAFTLVAHAIHQLRVVVRVHRDLVTVDVFRLDPL
jgi:hypothetical protein